MRERRDEHYLFEYPWRGTPFRGRTIAIDTETTADHPKEELHYQTPTMVLATVSDGNRHAVLSPADLPEFICRHAGREWVLHNVPFDWRVIRAALPTGHAAHRVLWEIADQGRLHDTGVLDFLVRLGDPMQPRGVMRPHTSLDALAMSLLDRPLPKDDRIRLTFAKMIGQDWADPRWQEWLDYAVKDVVTTWDCWQTLVGRAKEIMQEEGLVLGPWGYLTDTLQTQAALALSGASQLGMRIDLDYLHTVKTRLTTEMQKEVATLYAAWPDCFEVYVQEKFGKGNLKLVKSGTGVPRMKLPGLRKYLTGVAEALDLDPDEIPRTAKTGEISTAQDWWREKAGDHPLVTAWCRLTDLGKLLQFLVKLEEDPVAHPKYSVLVRSGRTSCNSPNIQQMPRESWFRDLFVPTPGYLLGVVDYSAIELHTLAAVLLDRFGESVLAEVLKTGRDPHAYTASLVLGEEYDHVLAQINTEKKAKKAGESGPFIYSDARQAAKAINFGVPGGLGARRLSLYAKTTYGVDMPVDEAARLRNKLIYQVYPELARYLDDDPAAHVAKNLRCTPGGLSAMLWPDGEFPACWRAAEKVVSGKDTKDRLIDGVPVRFTPNFRAEVWQRLYECSQRAHPSLRRALFQQHPSDLLRRQVFGAVTTTRTGRVRAGTEYGEARNTPFQGLAADGAKVALWRLHKEGFRVIAFIHDEIVCELPEATADLALAHMERIMVESMESVVGHGIPIKVEGCVARTWSK